MTESCDRSRGGTNGTRALTSCMGLSLLADCGLLADVRVHARDIKVYPINANASEAVVLMVWWLRLLVTSLMKRVATRSGLWWMCWKKLEEVCGDEDGVVVELGMVVGRGCLRRWCAGLGHGDTDMIAPTHRSEHAHRCLPRCVVSEENLCARG